MHRIRKSMYAVSCEGVGLIAGTLAYSRREAIKNFLNGGSERWETYKHAGYRTVKALVEVVSPRGRWRS